VASLGSSSVLGFASDLRPPGSVPNGQPNWPVRQPPSYAAPSHTPAHVPSQAASSYPGSGAVSLTAPGVAQNQDRIELSANGTQRGYREPSYQAQPSGYHTDLRDDEQALPRLGPARGSQVTAI